MDLLLPNPIIDTKEQDSIDELTKRYEKLCEPSTISKAGEKVLGLLPKKLRGFGNSTKNIITEQELYSQAMDIIGRGFKEVERQAAKFSVSEKMIIDGINAVSKDNKIYAIEEVCLKRGYDISKAVNKYKTNDFWIAFAEGAVTGIFGFAGLPFNIVLSTFLYYRAVQSIAMYYGYDIKNNSAEMIVASEVFMNALSPESNNCNELTSIIGKVMLVSKAEAVKQTVKKGWTEMASRGGTELLLTQIRALANKSAQKALKKAGQKGLENSIFKDVFGQIGRKLTQKVIAKSIPVVSGVIGALFDSEQMKKVLDYADTFYNKRFLLEKEHHIELLMGKTEDIIDVEFAEEAGDIELT